MPNLTLPLLLATLIAGSPMFAAPTKPAAKTTRTSATKPVAPGSWTAWSPLKDGYKNNVEVRWRHMGQHLPLSLHNRYPYPVTLDVEAEVTDKNGAASQHSESYALNAGELNIDPERYAIGAKIVGVRIKKMTATHPQWGELEVVPRNDLGARDAVEAAADGARKAAEADAATARAAAQAAMQNAQAANDAALKKALAWENDPARPRVYPTVVLGDRSAIVNAYVAQDTDTSIWPVQYEQLKPMMAEDKIQRDKITQLRADAQSDQQNGENLANQARNYPNTKAGRISAEIAAIAAQNAAKKTNAEIAEANAIVEEVNRNTLAMRQIGAEGQRLSKLCNAAKRLDNELRHQDAEYAYRQLFGDGPGDVSSHSTLATNLDYQRRYTEAEAEWNAALKLAAADQRPNILENLGICLSEQGRYRDAVDAYRSALAGSNKPGEMETCHYGIADALWRQDKLADAELEAREALKLDTQDWTIHSLLGSILEREEKWSDAETEYRAALSMLDDVSSPLAEQVFADLGDVLMKQQKWADAAAAYTSAAKLAPQRRDYRRKLGDALLKQQKWADAETQYRAGLKLDISDAFCHNGLGEALFQQGKTADATPEFREAVHLKPRQIFFWGMTTWL